MRTLKVKTELCWSTISEVKSWRVADGDLIITREDLTTVSFARGWWREAWEDQ